ncbi:hypothetical protein [Chryseobacterium indoltheticum]|uniref:hypothetical protein n=1 Tax=Chryseobacterium indoltheticum TaxID=254 RepID=UPI0013563E8A|nr:hypothetical protein [Chryseobacterium indoltheticum]
MECGRADWALERRNDLVFEGWRVVWEVSAWVREKFIKQRAFEKYNSLVFIVTVNKVLLFYLYYKINWGVSLSKGRQRDKRLRLNDWQKSVRNITGN